MSVYICLEQFKVAQKLHRILVSVLGFTAGQIQNKLTDPLGQFLIDPAGGGYIVLHVHQGHRHGRVPVIGQGSGEHFIHHYPQGIKVASLVQKAPPRLLRGNIMYASEGLLRGGEGGGGDGCGYSEIRHLRHSVGGQKDILGLYIPVYDSVFMGVCHPEGDGVKYIHRLRGLYRPVLLDVFFQSRPVYVFHNDIGQPLLLPHIVYSDDVVVGKHGVRPGFLHEFVHELLVVRIFFF